MLVASGIYSLIAGVGVGPVVAMVGLGVFVMIATVIVSWYLPRDTGELSET